MSEAKSREIESLIGEAITNHCFPGIVVLVSKRGRVVFSHHSGSRQLHPETEVMAADTIFDLAEMTQPLATALLSVLIMNAERIGLGERLGRFMPDLCEESRDLTLGQLLLHTGGLPADVELAKEFPDSKSIDYGRAVRVLLAVKPTQAPGSRVLFSQAGYLLLGQFLRRVTGVRLQELFAQLVAAPCALADTFFNPPVVLWGRVAATARCPWRKRWIRGQVYDSNSYCLGGEGGNAGLFSTGPSVMKLMSAFGADGVVNGHRLLSTSQTRLMRTCLTANLGMRRSLAFLLQGENSPVGPSYSEVSFGQIGANGTSVWMEPSSELTIVVLSNAIHLEDERQRVQFADFNTQLYTLIHRHWG